jgi:3-oxoacyl-[acyl-carrier protein] reductase
MRNVIVTGASRGLGLAIAGRLAAAGYRVIGLARTESAAWRAAVEASSGADSNAPGAMSFRSADLSEIGGIAALVSSLRKQFGPLYGLVNNAGLGTGGLLSMMRDEDIERLVRLNTLAPIVLTKYVLRSMMVESAGRIVNISSIVSATGYKGLSAYAATKASMVGFTRSLAREVGPLGITVNAVAPGFAATDMTNELGEEQRDKIARRSALRRLVEPQDVAAAVAYLFSEEARSITGITLTVDAGSTA